MREEATAHEYTGLVSLVHRNTVHDANIMFIKKTHKCLAHYSHIGKVSGSVITICYSQRLQYDLDGRLMLNGLNMFSQFCATED